jgi:hypothetical protein
VLRSPKLKAPRARVGALVVWAAVASVVALVAAGCGGGGGGEAAQPFARGTTINYVVLGDSVQIQGGVVEMQGGAAERYAADLEHDLGVKVSLRDESIGSAYSSDLSSQVRTDSRIRAELREADVITLNVPLGITRRCLVTSPAAYSRCMASLVPEYKRDVEAIFAALVALRPASTALIRATDTWQFAYRTMHQRGLYAPTTRYWQKYNAIVHQVASRYQIPVARAYDAINGPTGSKDPLAAGYVISDEVHLTSKGAALLANLYRDFGYRLATVESS